MRMRSRPENSMPATSKSGCVRLTTQLMPSSSRMRMPIAARMPDPPRHVALLDGGSLLARMEMKMMLSMPRTISSAVSVSSAIQTSGFVSRSTARA